MFGIQHGTRAWKRADVIGNNRLLIVIDTIETFLAVKRLLYAQSSCESRASQLSSNETRWSGTGRHWKSMQTKRKEEVNEPRVFAMQSSPIGERL